MESAAALHCAAEVCCPRSVLILTGPAMSSDVRQCPTLFSMNLTCALLRTNCNHMQGCKHYFSAVL